MDIPFESQTLERIEASRAFLTRLWACENVERPGFLVGYTGPKLRDGAPVRSALFSTEGSDSVFARLQDPSRYLAAQLQEIEGQLNFRGDFVPALTPSLGVVTIPSAFGCEIVWQKNDFPSVKPVIQNPDQITGLHIPALSAGILGQVYSYTTYFRQQTQGRFPIRVTDIQGPLDNASLIMGHNNFLLATRTHPREVHQLLELITEYTIEVVREQRRLAGNFVPSLMQPWMPPGAGLSISNDDSVMVSRQTMEEFAVPCFNRLSDDFGGLFIHSCGNWAHQIPALRQVRNLRGVEFGASEVNFKTIFNQFGGEIVTACRVGLNKEAKFSGMADYLRQILAARKTNRGLFIHLDITNGILDESWPETDLDELYALIDTARGLP